MKRGSTDANNGIRNMENHSTDPEDNRMMMEQRVSRTPTKVSRRAIGAEPSRHAERSTNPARDGIRYAIVQQTNLACQQLGAAITEQTDNLARGIQGWGEWSEIVLEEASRKGVWRRRCSFIGAGMVKAVGFLLSIAAPIALPMLVEAAWVRMDRR